MHDKYKKYDTDREKCNEKEELESGDREKSNGTRYDKWENEKYTSGYHGAEIEEYHRKIESPRDSNVANSESSRCRQCLSGWLVLEYDKKIGIRKTHIDDKCKNEIESHDDGYWDRIGNSEYTQEEYIKSDDRKWTKYGGEIVEFKEW
jgi:hypothetical protein